MEEKSNQIKLLVFGAARIDAFLTIPDDNADSYCNLNTQKCVVELSYAAKISMKSVEFLLGGNGANVSVGTKRMGIESFLVSEVGSDVMGNYTKNELAKEIDVSFVTQEEGVPGGFGAVIVYQGERTILSYYPPITPKFNKEVGNAEWVYLTSTGEKFEEYYEDVYSWIEGCHPKLAFNPGGRQIAKGKEWMGKYLSLTEVLIVNRQEGEEILGTEGETFGKEKDLISDLCRLGPKMVIITDGAAGSFAFDGNKFWKCGVLPIDAIERTGAGDAFSSGVLASLIDGKPMNEALIIGTVNSASVIGYYGSEPGLLKKEQLPEWLERAESSGVKVEEF